MDYEFVKVERRKCESSAINGKEFISHLLNVKTFSNFLFLCYTSKVE